MQKVLGLLTEDFRLYHDLVAALKARDLPFVSLSFSRRIPETVGALLTSPAEASRIRAQNVVPVDDLDAAITKALQLVKGRNEWREIRVGVDPGREPGIAVLGDGEVLDTGVAKSPEAVRDHIRRALRAFPGQEVRVRVGHGDPTNRNRVLNALASEGIRIEIVDEAGTTRRSPQPDVDAAIDIARTPGRRVEPPVDVTPTSGEVRDIQRRSRIRSAGRVTISSSLAASVAKGDVSLDEAIETQRTRERRSEH
jgi:hypothetical protein